QRIAEGLEKLYASRIADHLEPLAYHFSESTDFQKGLTYSVAAAEAAEKIYAHEEALAHYERARECAEALERRDALGQIEEGIGQVYGLRGDQKASLEHFDRAIALADDAATRALRQMRAGEICTRTGDPRGPEYLNAALASLDTEKQANARASCIGMLGRYRHHAGEPGEAVTLLEEAFRIAEPLDDTETLGHLYSYMAGALQHVADLEGSIAVARRSIAFGQRKGSLPIEATGCEFIAETSFVLGRWKDSIEYGGRDYEIGHRIGSLDRMAWGRYASMNGLHGAGRLQEARQHGEESLRLAERIGEERLHALAGARYVPLLCDLGEERLALEEAERYQIEADGLNAHLLRLAAREGRLAMLGELERWDEAGALARELVVLIESRSHPMSRVFCGPAILRALVESGPLELADHWGRVFLDAAVRSKSATFEAGDRRGIARLHEVRGDRSAAGSELDRA